ncbi:MAG: glycosyltransferase family 2 protein [Anaerolineales bacterium]|nr:glycosyltransferase family 2 protein [Anaerolineales bacterium]MCB0207308.1 glycosyltransferase family 2 protein [Anaerolineae bacterium]
MTISVISANNSALLLPCLQSIYTNTHNTTVEIFVVDNASVDGTGQAVAESFPEIGVIRNTTSQGFSTNNNLILGKGHGRYLMLLNDDTLVLDGALDALVDFMDSNLDTGAVGSLLLNPDHTCQPAFARFPNPLIEAIWPSTNWSHQLGRDKTEPFEVDSVCGAAMLVRRQVIEQVGMLDTAFDPIYSEEVDWCYRIKQAGWKIYTVPGSRIIHYGSVTMNRAVPRKYELLLSHKLLFFRKHMGNLAANVYRAVLGVMTAVKAVAWAARALFDKRYAERRDLHWYLLKRIPKL